MVGLAAVDISSVWTVNVALRNAPELIIVYLTGEEKRLCCPPPSSSSPLAPRAERQSTCRYALRESDQTLPLLPAHIKPSVRVRVCAWRWGAGEARALTPPAWRRSGSRRVFKVLWAGTLLGSNRSNPRNLSLRLIDVDLKEKKKKKKKKRKVWKSGKCFFCLV